MPVDENILRDILNRQIEVKEAVARIETKMDEVCKVQLKTCEDVKVLETKEITADGERKMLRKLTTIAIAAVGVISTLIGIVGTIRGWF